MTRTVWPSVFVLFTVAVAGSVLAQPLGPSAGGAGKPVPVGLDGPRFRSEAELVALEVCVKGRDGRFIENLEPDDFLVFEDGIAQPLSFFLSEARAPLAISLVIDRSASMDGERLERAKAAAVAFIQQLESQDLLEVITFNERAARPVPLGTNHHDAMAAVTHVTAGGSTGLFEAVAVGLHDLVRLVVRPDIDYRRALVVLSDGEDTSSRLGFEELRDSARRSGVLIYAISLRSNDRGRWLAAPYHLAALAHDTGGRAFAIQELQNLTAVYGEVAVELRHLYRIGYVPPDRGSPGSWRAVAVIVRDRDARVRTRAGYYAPRPPSALAGQR